MSDDQKKQGKTKKEKAAQPAPANATAKPKAKKSDTLGLKEIIFGGGILVFILGIAWDQYKKWESDWDSIDNDIQNLIYLIADADSGSAITPPTYESPREQKIKFIRESQVAIHSGRWSNLGNQIPEISQSSERRAWRDAIAGHNRIEKSEHPNEYANLMLKAKWQTVVAMTNSKTTTLSGAILKLAATPIIACKDCLSVNTTKVNLPNGIPTQDQVSGIAVDKLPYRDFSAHYPVFEVREAAGAPEPASVRKPKFLIPSFDTLKTMEQKGTLELKD